MKHILTFGTILCLATASILGQSPRDGQRSPKEVVQEFWEMEMEGGRLSPEGWKRAELFFVHPSPQPRDKVVIVTFEGSRADETARTRTEAEVYVECTEAGRLDSALRFEPSSHYSPVDKMMCKYSLAFTDKHWEFIPSGGAAKEVTGRPEWRIAEGPPGLRIGTATAIRYVTEIRDKTKDPVIKKNADQTLAKLSRFHKN